jgi:hypothetical protein
MHWLDLLALRVVQERFGSWNEVMAMPVDVVVDAFHYLKFQQEYQETYVEINKPES